MARKPTHPGEFIKDEFLEPHQEIRQEDFAQALGVNRVTLSKILNARQRVTPDVAIRLSRCLGTSAEVWLNMQTKIDVWEELHNTKHKEQRANIKLMLIPQAA